MRILSGVQPSGKLHIGNYFGAIRQFVSLQHEASECLYFIADMHALTSVRDGKTLKSNTMDVALDFLALGLDPEKAILFRQSDIPEVTQLFWILSALTPMGLLDRGHSFKDKLAKGLPADAGLYTYPVLMAADILLYGSDAVPVGKDQKQHLEFTRDICTKFNMTFVPGYNPQDPEGKSASDSGKHAQSKEKSRKGQKKSNLGILKMPEGIILDDVAVIPGTDGQKMSKSYNNTIDIFAPDKVVRKRIMSMKTDSTPVEAPKPDSPLFDLLRLLANPEEKKEIDKSRQEGGTGYGTYKLRLLELFHEHFDEARNYRIELESNPDIVLDVLEKGAEKARTLAQPIMKEVLKAAGLCGK